MYRRCIIRADRRPAIDAASPLFALVDLEMPPECRQGNMTANLAPCKFGPRQTLGPLVLVQEFTTEVPFRAKCRSLFIRIDLHTQNVTSVRGVTQSGVDSRENLDQLAIVWPIVGLSIVRKLSGACDSQVVGL